MTMDTYEGDTEDPLSLHKYLYAQDNPVDGSDPSGNDDIGDVLGAMDISAGLDALPNIITVQKVLSTGSKGGPDVTQALNRTLDEVAQTFQGWSKGVALASGERLLPGNGGVALGAWDIRELKDGGGKLDPLGSGRTITFYGVTYYSSAANYALWGKAFRLCHDRLGKFRWNLTIALSLATAYKEWFQNGLDLEGSEALDFTRYGYEGTLPPPHGVPGRSPNEIPIGSDIFHWKWLPGKNY